VCEQVSQLRRIGYYLTWAGPRNARYGSCQTLGFTFRLAVFAETPECRRCEVDGCGRPTLVTDPPGRFEDVGWVDVAEEDATGNRDERPCGLIGIAVTVTGCEPACERFRNGTALGGFVPTLAIAFISASCVTASRLERNDWR
jgi:hypothetical protein